MSNDQWKTIVENPLINGERAVRDANARHLNVAGVGEEALVSDNEKA
jgi:hypothetical protein